MSQLTKEEYDRLAAEQVRRSTAAGPTGPRALEEAVGGPAFIDASGNVIEGHRPTPKPDPFFTDERIQLPQRGVKDWARSAEGRQAIGAEIEARKPKARLWQGRDGMWHFQTRSGDVISYQDKQKLVEALIFGGRSDEEISAEMTAFLSAHPDYLRDPHVWSLLSEQLALAEKFVTAENLAEAWKNLKPQIDAKAVQVASRVLDEIESAGERHKYFDSLSYEQAEEAINAISKARKEGLI